MTKPFGAMELLARVDALLRRARVSAQHQASAARTLDHFGDVEVNRAAHSKLEKEPAQPIHIITVRKAGYRFEA